MRIIVETCERTHIQTRSRIGTFAWQKWLFANGAKWGWIATEYEQAKDESIRIAESAIRSLKWGGEVNISNVDAGVSNGKTSFGDVTRWPCFD